MSVADIARASGMSILELAAHVCTPRNLEALARVKQLHATQQEMLLGKLKRDALVRLAELTDEVPGGSADEIRAFEVMRRACVDLLRSGGSNTEKRSSRPGGPGGTRGYPGGGYHPEPLSPAFEAEVLEALEKLGREDEEQEEEVYPQITQITQIEDSPRRMNRGGFKSGSINRDEPRAQTSGSVCGCHGQVPPARVCENPVDPRANSLKQRACPWHPSPEVATRTGGTPMPPPEIEINRTRTRRVPPAPPHDGSIGQGQSGHCPGCPTGGHEDHAGPGTKHGTVGLDDAHPP